MHNASFSVIRYQDGRVGFTPPPAHMPFTILGKLSVKDGPLPPFSATYETIQDLYGFLTPGTWTFSRRK